MIGIMNEKIEAKKLISQLNEREKKFLENSLFINEPKNRYIDGANYHNDIKLYKYPHNYQLQTLFSLLYNRKDLFKKILKEIGRL